MNKFLNFYMDDSGSRQPDRSTRDIQRDWDWFALGGILIKESDEELAREEYDLFCKRWGIVSPLRSHDIRNHTKNFQWLSSLKITDFKRYSEFYASLHAFLLGLPVLGIACVIDRPGYNLRYQEEYQHKRWSLCKTAFTIAVERAAKYAAKRGMKLRVLPERCNVKEDRWLKEYYEDLKVSAAPFDASTSAKYGPLSPQIFKEVLYDFKLKDKSSPLAQIADMYLWPICMGGYDKENLPYKALMAARRLVEYAEPKGGESDLGTKYSCFDFAPIRSGARNTKARISPGFGSHQTAG
jgi:hypothetical protein